MVAVDKYPMYKLNDKFVVIQYQKNIKANKENNKSSIKKAANYILQNLYPNTFSQIKYSRNYSSIQENWKEESEQLLKTFNQNELQKYNSINSEIRQYFEDGLLSPSKIYTTIKTPQCFSVLEDSSSDFVINGVKQITNDLISIKNKSKQFNYKLALLFFQDRAYVSKNDNAILKNKLLMDVDSNLISSSIVNKIYNNIANKLEMPFLDCTNTFAEQSDSVMLYYPYDGHLTYKGNTLISKEVSAWLEQNYLR